MSTDLAIDYLSSNINTIFKAIIIPIILSFICFYSCFIGSANLGYISILLACLYLLLCKFDFLLPAMIYLSLFAEVYKVNGLMLYGFICIVYILRCSFNLNKKLNIFLWFILYSITHLLSNDFTFANISPIFYLLTLLVASLSYKQVHFRNCSIMFILGCIVTSFLAFLKPLSVNLQNIFSEDVTEGVTTNIVLRYSGLSYDPNFYTIISFVSLSLLLFDKQNKSWLIVLITICLTFFGFLTYSKSFLLIFVVLFLLFILDNQKNKFNKIIFLIGIALIFLYSTFNDIIQVFILRFSNISNLNELTTGRDYLWNSYWNIISQSSLPSILFGHEIIKGMKAAHNTYIEILFRFGVVGSLVDFFLIKTCFKLINKRLGSLIHLCILVLIASLLFNLSAYSFPMLWSCLFMLFILISYRNKNKGTLYNI